MIEHGPILWVAQGLAAVAFAVMFWSNYSINRTVTIAGRGGASAVFTIEYLLLGMWTTAGAAALNAVRGFSMAGAHRLRTRRALMVVFLTAHVALFTWLTESLDTWVAVLPLLGATISTVAFSLEKVSRIKALNVAGGIVWVGFFTMSGLWVNVAGDSIALVLAAIAWKRARRAEHSAAHQTP